jgi:hypothetical protein
MLNQRWAKVAHETQDFADPFEAGEWRTKWVASMDTPKDQRSEETLADTRHSWAP